jgi:nickel-dependent lactate racemase
VPHAAAAPILADGGVDRAIGSDELAAHVRDLVAAEVIERGARRVLLVPPDHTRLQSRAGEITALVYEELATRECSVTVLPATGTHRAMSPAEIDLLFGRRIPLDRVVEHRWRDRLVQVGEIGADEVAALSGGRFAEAIPVEVDELLLADWDLVVSIGQVVPHEVIGMANFTKNLVIGLGGGATVHRSHFLGAVCDMETIMGRVQTPVRDVVDAAFDRFLAPSVRVLWILTVMQDTETGVVQRGLFAGRGGSGESGGSAYRAAAGLAARCNVTVLARPLERVACWLDGTEFQSTWLANKAVYRTRMAIADGGELIVLAPGVVRFGEDPAVDALIRRHGFRGTAATLAALDRDSELAENLGAAAHLIHGSSEGRFRIVYCTDPERGGLTRGEVEQAGYTWRALPTELARLDAGGTTPTGPRRDRDGVRFTHIANPALGLWATTARFP